MRMNIKIRCKSLFLHLVTRILISVILRSYSKKFSKKEKFLKESIKELRSY